MNRRFAKLPLLLALALALVASACAAPTPVPAPAARNAPEPQDPALLVLISVDQLRGDLLQRYDRFFTGGIRRLLDEGLYYTRATHDHAFTETAPGHATLSTGVYPARSGIAANTWREQLNGEWVRVYNVADSLSPIVGAPELPGRSPRNLRAPGLADWLLAVEPEGKVVSLGGKDRSAILLAGQSRGQVYWYSDDVGRFVTSAYYAERDADWVERFNRRQLPMLLDSVWALEVPEAARSLARPDPSPYEGRGGFSTFPHRFAEEAGDRTFAEWAGTTPFIDVAVLELAEVAVRAADLGKDSATDLLALGLAQTDYVGHGYGPLSLEQLDNLLRLDRELGELFRYLDREVGRERWALALSADHGALTLPEHRAEIEPGEPAYRLPAAEAERLREQVREVATSAPSAQAPERIAALLREQPYVADAVPLDELLRGEPADSFRTLLRRSYVPGRAAGMFEHLGVAVRLTEGTYAGYPTGTGHGSPYLYDRWVPLIFYGAGVPAGRRAENVATVDLAPTLARLGGVPVPVDLDGRPLIP